jgi:hypothetical protein
MSAGRSRSRQRLQARCPPRPTALFVTWLRDLAVIVPSRGRPHNIARLIEAMDRTCRGDTTLIVGVDEDDPHLDAYRRSRMRGRRPAPARHLVAWLNDLAVPNAATSTGSSGTSGTTTSPAPSAGTPGSSRASNATGFCFGDDLDPGRRPRSLSHPHLHDQRRHPPARVHGAAAHSAHVRRPGLVRVGASHVDRVPPDVVLEHMHYTVGGKAPHDESYEASTGLIPQDCTNYNDYCDDPDGVNADIAKLGGTPFTVGGARGVQPPAEHSAPVGRMMVSILLATTGRPDMVEAFVEHLVDTTEGTTSSSSPRSTRRRRPAGLGLRTLGHASGSGSSRLQDEHRGCSKRVERRARALHRRPRRSRRRRPRVPAGWLDAALERSQSSRTGGGSSASTTGTGARSSPRTTS